MYVTTSTRILWMTRIKIFKARKDFSAALSWSNTAGLRHALCMNYLLAKRETGAAVSPACNKEMIIIKGSYKQSWAYWGIISKQLAWNMRQDPAGFAMYEMRGIKSYLLKLAEQTRADGLTMRIRIQITLAARVLLFHYEALPRRCGWLCCNYQRL